MKLARAAFVVENIISDDDVSSHDGLMFFVTMHSNVVCYEILKTIKSLQSLNVYKEIVRCRF